MSNATAEASRQKSMVSVRNDLAREAKNKRAASGPKRLSARMPLVAAEFGARGNETRCLITVYGMAPTRGPAWESEKAPPSAARTHDYLIAAQKYRVDSTGKMFGGT